MWDTFSVHYLSRDEARDSRFSARFFHGSFFLTPSPSFFPKGKAWIGVSIYCPLPEKCFFRQIVDGILLYWLIVRVAIYSCLLPGPKKGKEDREVRFSLDSIAIRYRRSPEKEEERIRSCFRRGRRYCSPLCPCS